MSERARNRAYPTAEDIRRMVVCEDRCSDPSMHDFYVSGGGFRWCWPKFNRTDPADKRTRVTLNRYPHNIIGAGVILFGRGYGVRWKTASRKSLTGPSLPPEDDRRLQPTAVSSLPSSRRGRPVTRWTLPDIDRALTEAAGILRAELLALRTEPSAIDRARKLVDRLLDHRLSLMPPAVADLEAAE